MDLHKIVQTAKTLKAFIGESVLDEEELQSDKRKRQRVGLLSLALTLLLVSDVPGYAYQNVKLLLAPPPREQEKAMSDDRWVEFLERRITVSLNKIDELEALLKRTQDELILSEENRARLEERIKALNEELESLKRLSDEGDEGTLYDRLQRSQDR
jgi:hypothetical protein